MNEPDTPGITVTVGKALEQLRAAYRDVAQPGADDVVHGWRRIEPEQEWPAAFMVFQTLVECLGLEYHYKPMEKTLWSLRVSYVRSAVLLEHGKFGLRAYVPESDSDDAAKELLQSIDRTRSLVESILEDRIAQRIATGQVAVRNRQGEFYRRFEYFRNRAATTYEQLQDGESDRGLTVEQAVLEYNARIRTSENARFDSIAAIDAYFSWLEHVLVLLLPFANYDPEKEDLVAIISKWSWRQKWLRVLPLTSPDAHAVFKSICRVKESHRNPESHGGFRDGFYSLLVHGQVGAVPAVLSKYRERPHLFMHAEAALSFHDVCKSLDECTAWLANGPCRYGFQLVRGGLDVAFDRDNVAAYKAASTSDEAFTGFLEYWSYQEDQATNMDW